MMLYVYILLLKKKNTRFSFAINVSEILIEWLEGSMLKAHQSGSFLSPSRWIFTYQALVIIYYDNFTVQT